MFRKMLTPVENGLKVMACESKWFFIEKFKRWEIRQLQKRLAEEYATLGRTVAEAQDSGTDFNPKASEHDLTLRQIAFLRDEIKHLEEALAQAHATHLKKSTAPSDEA